MEPYQNDARTSSTCEVMIDIETLGLKPGSVIVSIGAVAFTANGEEVESFYRKLDLSEQVKRGLTVDVETVQWWLTQGKEAQDSTFGGERISAPLALLDLNIFVCNHSPSVIWAKGPQFDIVQLECAYDAFDLKQPWSYRAIRDLRTEIAGAGGSAVVEDMMVVPEANVAHNALADCRFQIAELVAVRRLRPVAQAA